jgi:hypothetical protein
MKLVLSIYTALSEPFFVLGNDLQIELINNATAANFNR